MLRNTFCRAMDETFVLPDAQSPDLCLTHPTSSEFESIYSLSFLEWGDALNLPQYLEESAFLTTVPLAKDGGMSIWFLTDETHPPDHRPILCSCETFRKRGFVVDPRGHLSEGIVHSVASVFCDPKYRGRGYAARLMRELAILLPSWQSGLENCIGSILYSDIGKTYYAKLGWHPFPLNNHIELDPVHIAELPQTGVKAVIREDLDQLCKDDEAMIRTAMNGSSSKKTRMMVVPDLDHMLWHHSKEDFACEKLFGKHPRMKGAIIGELNDRMWVIWTHRYYGDPYSASSNNTLYILRIVIERRDTGPDQREHQIGQMRALLWAAQNEAAEWSLSCVKLWDPAYLVQDMVERTGIQHRKVEREEESLASLLWFGGGSGREDMVEWLGNEKYGWC